MASRCYYLFCMDGILPFLGKSEASLQLYGINDPRPNLFFDFARPAIFFLQSHDRLSVKCKQTMDIFKRSGQLSCLLGWLCLCRMDLPNSYLT